MIAENSSPFSSAVCDSTAGQAKPLTHSDVRSTVPENISESTLKCLAGVKFQLLHAAKQHSHILHWGVSFAFKNKTAKKHELIILAVTPSLDTVSLPGGNEKPPKAVILLIAVSAAQHELYFYILKRKPMPHVLLLFFSKGFKARQPQSSTPEVWTVIDFLFLPSIWGKYEKKWGSASPGAKHPLQQNPLGAVKLVPPCIF